MTTIKIFPLQVLYVGVGHKLMHDTCLGLKPQEVTETSQIALYVRM